jgi:hypothetical protein
MRIIAFITDPAPVERILGHLGEPPRRAFARIRVQPGFSSPR